MPKPKPTSPKKCVSLNLSEVELKIVNALAMERYRGNQSEAARQIFQEWDWWKGYIAANQGKQ